MAPPLDPKHQNEIVTSAKSHSLQVAFFHTMAFRLSLEINQNEISHSTQQSFLKVLYNVARIGQTQIPFEQYYRIHVEGPHIAICETVSDTVFVLDSRFPQKVHYFHAALQDALDASNNVLRDFGYHQKLKNMMQKFTPRNPNKSIQPTHLEKAVTAPPDL